MPFFVEIRRPSNDLLLANFFCWGNYHYRLADGVDFPLAVAYAWCHRCESFVEAEQPYQLDDIQGRIDELACRKEHWPQIDARFAQILAECNREMAANLTQQKIHDRWVAALEWFKSRTTPPRCLKCGSFFAIKALPMNEVIPHPGSGGTIAIRVAGHASCLGIPDNVYFTGDGIRIADLTDASSPA